MRYVLIVLAIACLVSFSWARKAFFVRGREQSKYRFGIGVFGTVFGVAQLLALVFDGGSSLSTKIILSVSGYMLALMLFWWSVMVFSQDRPMIAFSSGAPNKLMVAGPYAFVRHPFYVSYASFWIAGVLGSCSVVTITGAVVMCVYYVLAAREEEREIGASALGPCYSKYKASVGMFFPRVFL